MERTSVMALITAGLFLLASSFTGAMAQDKSNRGFPGQGQMIQQRLMTDLQDLKEEIKRLRDALNQLRNRVDSLEKQNQQYKSTIEKLQSGSVKTDGKNDGSNSVSKKERAPVVRATEETEYGTWVIREDRPYPIMIDPLDHEIIYVSDDETTLSNLAHKYYHDGNLWREIYQYNSDKLSSPNVVPPKTRLRLPSFEEIE